MSAPAAPPLPLGSRRAGEELDAVAADGGVQIAVDGQRRPVVAAAGEHREVLQRVGTVVAVVGGGVVRGHAVAVAGTRCRVVEVDAKAGVAGDRVGGDADAAAVHVAVRDRREDQDARPVVAGDDVAIDDVARARVAEFDAELLQSGAERVVADGVVLDDQVRDVVRRVDAGADVVGD
jgi:hypothetical protein